MKIEIDLNDILCDEDSRESVRDSVCRQIVDAVTTSVSESMKNEINSAIAKEIGEQLQHLKDVRLPELLNNFLDTEFVRVDRYGCKLPPTTIRTEMIDELKSLCTYSSKSSNYDKNIFTRTVDDAVATKMKEFQSQFNKQVDSKFFDEAMAYATEKLKKRLSIAH